MYTVPGIAGIAQMMEKFYSQLHAEKQQHPVQDYEIVLPSVMNQASHHALTCLICVLLERTGCLLHSCHLQTDRIPLIRCPPGFIRRQFVHYRCGVVIP